MSTETGMWVKGARSKMANPFIGAWTLIEQTSFDESGTVIHVRGEHPIGLLIYTETGQMAAQLMRRARADHADLGSLDVAMSEYLGYFGTYTIHESDSVIVHHVIGASYPAYIGTDQRRRYEFLDDGALILSADGIGGARRLLWRRMS